MSVIACSKKLNKSVIAAWVLKLPEINSFCITQRLVYLVSTKCQKLKIRQGMDKLSILTDHFRGGQGPKTIITRKLILIHVIRI